MKQFYTKSRVSSVLQVWERPVFFRVAATIPVFLNLIATRTCMVGIQCDAFLRESLHFFTDSIFNATELGFIEQSRTFRTSPVVEIGLAVADGVDLDVKFV